MPPPRSCRPLHRLAGTGLSVGQDTDTGHRLEAVADQLEALRAERDRLVVQRRAEGVSLAVIAREARLSRQGVLA